MRIAGLRRSSVYQLVFAPFAAGGQLSFCGASKHEATSKHLEATVADIGRKSELFGGLTWLNNCGGEFCAAAQT